ncbi:MAG TPA: phospho-N-acetylmuramoyl-pentapeptide-transferase [Chthonomonadales bacterium]|nr:phospho-N-acetylmuramoyl-pentapeptide-transferase [Chthonomonadales bacterium]
MYDTTVLGFLVAFGLCALMGGPVVRSLARRGARQRVSDDAPSAHASKQTTPTMGGLLILLGVSVPVAILTLLQPVFASALGVLALMLGFGAIGFADDLLKTRRGRNQGLTAPQKLALQFAVACAFLWWMRAGSQGPDPWGGALHTTLIALGSWGVFDLGDAYYPLAAVFIVGFANAVNLMDGLDGLAAGVCAIIAVAMAATAVAMGRTEWVTVFAAAVAGACVGFLWFNAHPALVFMGDTGSLALGAALAGLALWGKVEAPFQAFAAVPWAVALSVLLQVGVFKALKRWKGIEYARTHRVLRRAPLHHHFEEMGWPETRVVARFWVATAVCVAATLAFGMHP